jgi:hypothetical protein
MIRYFFFPASFLSLSVVFLHREKPSEIYRIQGNGTATGPVPRDIVRLQDAPIAGVPQPASRPALWGA